MPPIDQAGGDESTPSRDLETGEQILLKVRRDSLTALATSLSLRFNPANSMTGRHGIGRELGGGDRKKTSSRENATP